MQCLSDPRVSYRFPRSARVLSSSQYKQLRHKGARFFGKQIAIEYREGKAPQPKLGITVSRKFGKAHDRNRFKRCVREAFREFNSQLPPHLELNIFPCKGSFELSKLAILIELKQFLAKITNISL